MPTAETMMVRRFASAVHVWTRWLSTAACSPFRPLRYSANPSVLRDVTMK